MSRFSSATRIALAVVVVLGLSGSVTAQVSVPLFGRLAGDDIATPQVPPFVSVQVKATGNATQLGNFTYLGQFTVNSTTRIGSGNFLFTAANGDRVYGTMSGQATFTPPNVLSIVEIGTITGGTGRFAHATGSFTMTRSKNTVTNATTASFNGTITTPRR